MIFIGGEREHGRFDGLLTGRETLFRRDAVLFASRLTNEPNEEIVDLRRVSFDVHHNGEARLTARRRDETAPDFSGRKFREIGEIQAETVRPVVFNLALQRIAELLEFRIREDFVELSELPMVGEIFYVGDGKVNLR